MLHENVLIKARVRELEEQVAEITKRKGRKRKRIQTSGTIEYSVGVLYVAFKAQAASQSSKKARSSYRDEQALPGQRHCRNCGKTGHNARTCQKDKEEEEESDSSASYVSSLGSRE